MLENRNLDEGTSSWRPGPADLTRLDAGELPAEILLDLAGAEGEEGLFANSSTGRMTAAEFEALVSDVPDAWPARRSP